MMFKLQLSEDIVLFDKKQNIIKLYNQKSTISNHHIPLP
jgi:hypothetical protein